MLGTLLIIILILALIGALPTWPGKLRIFIPPPLKACWTGPRPLLWRPAT